MPKSKCFMAFKVSFLSFVAVVVKSIRFTNAESKEQRAKSKEQGAGRSEGRRQRAEMTKHEWSEPEWR